MKNEQIYCNEDTCTGILGFSFYVLALIKSYSRVPYQARCREN